MRRFAVVLAVLAVAAAVTVFCWVRFSAGPKVIVLQDGTEIRCVALTYGTNHVIARLRPGIPPLPETIHRALAEWAPEWFPLRRHETPEPRLVAWLEVTPGPGPPSGIAVRAVDDQGYEGGGDDTFHHARTRAGGPATVTLALHSFPIRSKEITLRVYSFASMEKFHLEGSFRRQNPAFTDLPPLSAEPLPIVRRHGDLTVRIIRSSFSLASSQPRYDLGRYGVILEKRLRPGKPHGFTLDEHGMHALGGVIQQLRPPREMVIILSRYGHLTIEGAQRLKSRDHPFARQEVGCSGLSYQFGRQRVVWIDEHDSSERNTMPSGMASVQSKDSCSNRRT